MSREKDSVDPSSLTKQWSLAMLYLVPIINIAVTVLDMFIPVFIPIGYLT